MLALVRTSTGAFCKANIVKIWQLIFNINLKFISSINHKTKVVIVSSSNSE